VTIVLASPALKAKTSAISGLATLAEVQALAEEVASEAYHAGATYFVCMGEPTLALWANLHACGILDAHYSAGYYQHTGKIKYTGMTCLASTTERSSTDTAMPDGSIKTVATFKHCAWRAMF
jgi:hypothetical protein